MTSGTNSESTAISSIGGTATSPSHVFPVAASSSMRSYIRGRAVPGLDSGDGRGHPRTEGGKPVAGLQILGVVPRPVGVVPERMVLSRVRPGPLQGLRLDRLAPVHHPGHARPGCPDHPRHHHRRTARRQSAAHRADCRRDPPTLHALVLTRPLPPQHFALVNLAMKIPCPNPTIPLPGRQAK